MNVTCGGDRHHVVNVPRSHATGNRPTMTQPQDESFDQLLEAMKKAARALKDADIPFVLGGGLACWARGGPKTEHDVDLLVKPEHAEQAQQALADAGMRTERPPEDWLLKAYDNGVLIDLIFSPKGGTIDDEIFRRAEDLEVHAMRLKVAPLEDVIAQKLLALSEQNPNFASVLELGRSLREQVDWDDVRERTKESPFAKAYFTLLEELEIV
jgi:predicted nucleotidyltransferase